MNHSILNRMKLLWLTWKDIDHPHAGGAERIQHELATRLVADGHSVTILTSRPKGATKTSKKYGYKIIRGGNRYTVYIHAWRYYRKHLKDWADIVIEEVNTVPFFSKLYLKNERRMLFVHQLARKIWFYEYFFPLNVVGYLIEPLYLRFIAGPQVITVSNSSKQDLMRHGHKEDNISIISEGIDTTPVSLAKAKNSKQQPPSLLLFGSLRPMKRPHLGYEAFLIAKQSIPDLRLIIAGSNSSRYGQQLVKRANASRYANDITVTGPVTEQQKINLMQTSTLLLGTALKEGWGLTITEAASQGTPAVAFDVDGLRDSASCVVEPTPQAMATQIVQLLQDDNAYQSLQADALKSSRSITFEQSYKDFLAALNI